MIRIIANPAAGRGRARKLVPSAHAAFAALGSVDLRETACAGDEARLVREALDAGVRVIVALGGDGTWSKIAAAIVEARSDCILALLAGGTGNDLAKNLGLPARDPVATASLIAAGTERRIDVGRIDGRIFVNCAGFGFDAAVLQATEGRTWPRGDALYIACALEQILGYRGVALAMGRAAFANSLLTVIANGPRFGGSFRIAPGADMSDGALDIVSVADATPVRRVQLLAAAVRGAHLGLPGVERTRSAETVFRFREPPSFQVDGDLYRASGEEVVVSCLPAALRVVSAASASPAVSSGSAR